ncbi:MAG: hypothetical protein HYR91_13070 [Flavobacteriia bacterium]|nr:hypothetical protein [Flavobacteriia bacterium]
MQKTISIAFTIFLFISNYYSQDKSIEYKLLELEEAYFQSDNDSLKNLILFEKTNIYIENNQITNELLNEIKRVNYKSLNDSLQYIFLWNASLSAYLLKDQYYTIHFLDLYETNFNSTKKEFQLLKLLAYSDFDSSTVNTIIKIFPEFNCLKCIENSNLYELKSKKTYTTLAFLIPGTGLIANQNYVKGLIALSINTLSFFSIRWLYLNRLYINMISWGGNFIGKFYFGNVVLTKKELRKKELKKQKKLTTECELQLKLILEKYPLMFQL